MLVLSTLNILQFINNTLFTFTLQRTFLGKSSYYDRLNTTRYKHAIQQQQAGKKTNKGFELNIHHMAYKHWRSSLHLADICLVSFTSIEGVINQHKLDDEYRTQVQCWLKFQTYTMHKMNIIVGKYNKLGVQCFGPSQYDRHQSRLCL